MAVEGWWHCGMAWAAIPGAKCWVAQVRRKSSAQGQAVAAEGPRAKEGCRHRAYWHGTLVAPHQHETAPASRRRNMPFQVSSVGMTVAVNARQ